MPLFDLPLPQLRQYRPDRHEPTDFDEFWSRTLDETRSHGLDTAFVEVDVQLPLVNVFDVTFAGYGGDPISAWFISPKTSRAVGCVVKYLGYHGGRGHPHTHLVWPAAGWAVLVVDTRGQGASTTGSHGATADPHGTDGPQVPGMLTKGIASAEGYYYRRVIADAVRAVDVAASHPHVDPARIVTAGHSQGGGLAQAAAALHDGVSAALIDAPFLTLFRRAAEIATTGPYGEIVHYLAAQRDREEDVFATLSYFDGVNFAARGRVPALYSTALMDTVCPPSTVFAAYNHWTGDKDIDVWRWNGHECGAAWQIDNQLRFINEHSG